MYVNGISPQNVVRGTASQAPVTEENIIRDQSEIMSAKDFQSVSVYVAMALLKSMKGAVLESGVKHALEMLTGSLKPTEKIRLQQFNRKIRFTGFGRKDYSGQNDVLAAILKGLIHQTKIQILHYSHGSGKEKYHIIHPYTLLLHRDSLYLHAYVEGYGETRTFMIDRINEAVARDETFKYPAKYNPDEITDGSFGIFKTTDDIPEKIKIRFKEILWEYLTTWKWHSSQKFSPVKDGWFAMEVELANVDEFIPWVLQFGSDAIVEGPETVRGRMRKELRMMVGEYS